MSTAYAAKIYRQYGKESIDNVKENPYRLADDIWGIGFKTADGIARKMGYEMNDERRLRSGLIYTLNQLADEGHCYVEEEQLIATAKQLLEADEECIRTAMTHAIETEDLMLDGTAIYLPPFYYAECGTANRLNTLVHTKEAGSIFTARFDLAKLQRETGIEYDEVQVEAIRQAIASKVMVLTGGPGTGKTTTTKAIIAALQSAGMRILLAAPTGRAAKRMSEATGMEAKTIHRLLEYNPQDGYKRNDENPLEGDALIVDECSMIDIILMNNLTKALPTTMRLVLVGDIDQLPSVGAGNVLRDIIDSGVIPVVRLTHLPTGTVEPHCDECPCHQPWLLPRHQQRSAHRLLLHEAGRAGEGGGDHCFLSARPTAQGLPPAECEHTGTHAHAARRGGGCQPECGSATGTEPQHGGTRPWRLSTFKGGRPCDAAAQQLRQGCI